MSGCVGNIVDFDSFYQRHSVCASTIMMIKTISSTGIRLRLIILNEFRCSVFVCQTYRSQFSIRQLCVFDVLHFPIHRVIYVCICCRWQQQNRLASIKSLKYVRILSNSKQPAQFRCQLFAQSRTYIHQYVRQEAHQSIKRQ